VKFAFESLSSYTWPHVELFCNQSWLKSIWVFCLEYILYLPFLRCAQYIKVMCNEHNMFCFLTIIIQWTLHCITFENVMQYTALQITFRITPFLTQFPVIWYCLFYDIPCYMILPVIWYCLLYDIPCYMILPVIWYCLLYDIACYTIFPVIRYSLLYDIACYTILPVVVFPGRIEYSKDFNQKEKDGDFYSNYRIKDTERKDSYPWACAA